MALLGLDCDVAHQSQKPLETFSRFHQQQAKRHLTLHLLVPLSSNLLLCLQSTGKAPSFSRAQRGHKQLTRRRASQRAAAPRICQSYGRTQCSTAGPHRCPGAGLARRPRGPCETAANSGSILGNPQAQVSIALGCDAETGRGPILRVLSLELPDIRAGAFLTRRQKTTFASSSHHMT